MINKKYLDKRGWIYFRRDEAKFVYVLDLDKVR